MHYAATRGQSKSPSDFFAEATGRAEQVLREVGQGMIDARETGNGFYFSHYSGRLSRALVDLSTYGPEGEERARNIRRRYDALIRNKKSILGA